MAESLTDVFTCVYTENNGGRIMVCTKVFTSGNSQAVRIPKEFHIDSSELYIKKIGSTIILFPQSKPWENLKKSLSEFTDDFMAEDRNQPQIQQREDF